MTDATTESEVTELRRELSIARFDLAAAELIAELVARQVDITYARGMIHGPVREKLVDAEGRPQADIGELAEELAAKVPSHARAQVESNEEWLRRFHARTVAAEQEDGKAAPRDVIRELNKRYIPPSKRED